MKRILVNYKKTTLIIALVTLLVVSAGVTLAYMSDLTGSIVNIFFPGDISAEVIEEFDGEIKEHVQIKNTSERVDAYIRAYIVVTWKDDNGNVYPAKPVQGQDYTFRFGSNANWDLETSDGYYYYSNPIAPGMSTPDLIRECKPVAGRSPAGYHLEVEIIADAVQASPSSAVVEAWGVTYSNGKISK